MIDIELWSMDPSSEDAPFCRVSLHGGWTIPAGEELLDITSDELVPGEEITETWYPCVVTSTPSCTANPWGSLRMTSADGTTLISKVLRVGQQTRYFTKKQISLVQVQLWTLITSMRDGTLENETQRFHQQAVPVTDRGGPVRSRTSREAELIGGGDR